MVSLFFYDQIFDLVIRPYNQAREALGEDVTVPVVTGPAGGFLLYFKLCGLTALVFTSPYWLYQIWAFILPGLHPQERTWSRSSPRSPAPCSCSASLVGYLTLPKGLEVLIGFTPADLTSLIDFPDYLTFFTRTLLVFGIAFEIPVFVVLLNLAGIVTGKWLGEHRAWIDPRRVPVRRHRHAVDRPVHDVLHGGADGAALPGLAR